MCCITCLVAVPGLRSLPHVREGRAQESAAEREASPLSGLAGQAMFVFVFSANADLWWGSCSFWQQVSKYIKVPQKRAPRLWALGVRGKASGLASKPESCRPPVPCILINPLLCIVEGTDREPGGCCLKDYLYACRTPNAVKLILTNNVFIYTLCT